jgi:dipeptidase D
VSGLQGGHSGVDIHKGRGNAVRIIGRVLQTLMSGMPLGIAAINGGSKRNAIPREASATVVIEGARAQDLAAVVSGVEEAVRSELGAFDAGVRITLERAARPERVLNEVDAAAIVGLLGSQHHGVLAMSPDVAGLVQTSTNLATVSTKKDEVEIETSQRSPIESAKMDAGRMVATVFRIGGFKVGHSGGYPGWKPEPGSDLVRKCQAVYTEILGTVPELVAMHAGLECGVIGEKYPGMQMVSFGPHIVDPHSPSERLKISSVGPFWAFLTGLLERI